MKIAITGSSGFIGSALLRQLQAKGHEVLPVLRQGGRAGIVPEGIDAVVHLAGAGISDKRWTRKYKQEILESRTEGTQSVALALAAMKKKPKVLISASAVGIYGPHGSEALDENAGPGNDFLAKVCRNWEEATEPARKAGIRVVTLRTGLVLGRNGGALKKMLFPFQLGLGGIIGSGDQFYSWITLNDWLAAAEHLLDSTTAVGPYNLTAPGACSNRDYTRALGGALKRPTIFPMPAFAARLAFGEMADALLLSGQNVKPAKLIKEGFKFQANNIDEAFRQVLTANEAKP